MGKGGEKAKRNQVRRTVKIMACPVILILKNESLPLPLSWLTRKKAPPVLPSATNAALFMLEQKIGGRYHSLRFFLALRRLAAEITGLFSAAVVLPDSMGWHQGLISGLQDQATSTPLWRPAEGSLCPNHHSARIRAQSSIGARDTIRQRDPAVNK
jgi:hypothetical protein